MELWAQQMVNGLTIGGAYALIALGYTMVYGILQMINFAHGEVFMLGAFGGYYTLILLREGGLLEASPAFSLALAFLAGILVSSLIALVLERVAYRPLRNAPRLAPLISAIGASIFLQNVMLQVTRGRPQVYPNIFPQGAIILGELRITYIKLFIILMSLLLMVILYLFIQRSRIGKAIRAVAEDKETAALMGIDVDFAVATTFLLGGAAAGAAGVMMGLYYSQIDYFMGFIPGIKAFTAAVLGGIGNIPGAMLGGFFLGLAETFAAQVFPSVYKDVVAFLLLVLVLMIRPTGILGEVVGKRF